MSARLRMAFLVIVVVFNNANGTMLCDYAAYTATALRTSLRQVLAERGASVVPAFYLGEETTRFGEELVVSRGEQNGYFRFTEDLRAGTASLSISDNDRNLIAVANEFTYCCASGMCHESTFTICMGTCSNTLKLTQESGYGITYVIGNGKLANVTLWRSEFKQWIGWVTKVLLDSAKAQRFRASSRTQSFALLLASNPVTAPWLPYLNISTNRRGRIAIKGRMNQGIYNEIVDMAIFNGFPDIDPDVIIDSAAVLAPDPDKLVECLG